MIDAALFTAAAAANPQSSLPEGATPEGFGDVLAAMLGAQTPAVAEGELPEQAKGQGQGAEPALAAVEALRRAGRNAIEAVVGRGRHEAADAACEPAESAEAETDEAGATAETAESKRQTDGKASAAAWHASAQALTHAPTWSAVAVATAAQDTAGTVDVAHGEPSPSGPTGEDTAQSMAASVETPAPVDTPIDTPSADVPRAEAELVSNERALGDPPVAGGAVEASDGQVTPAARAQAPERSPAAVYTRMADTGSVGGAEATASVAPATAAAPVAPVQHMGAGVLQRVLDAIEQAEHRPPPNTMVVELPAEGGEDGLRLLVSVRGETVQVSGGPGDQGLPPGWARPLADALAQRGMNLDGFADDSAPGRRRSEDDERAGDGSGRGRTSRRAVTDDGALRL